MVDMRSLGPGDDGDKDSDNRRSLGVCRGSRLPELSTALARGVVMAAP